LASGEVKIEHCPTNDMVDDFFTKPLQGALSIKFRSEIMNVNPATIVTGLQDCRSVLNYIVTGVTVHSDKTNAQETDTTGWTTVQSKQNTKEKRMWS
jgi:hypothetical protein